MYNIFKNQYIYTNQKLITICNALNIIGTYYITYLVPILK